MLFHFDNSDLGVLLGVFVLSCTWSLVGSYMLTALFPLEFSNDRPWWIFCHLCIMLCSSDRLEMTETLVWSKFLDKPVGIEWRKSCDFYWIWRPRSMGHFDLHLDLMADWNNSFFFFFDIFVTFGKSFCLFHLSVFWKKYICMWIHVQTFYLKRKWLNNE